MNTNKEFKATNFQHGFQDHLNDLGIKCTVNAFWQDGKQHITVEIEQDEESEKTLNDHRFEIEGIMETYGPEDVWVGYELNSFWSNGSAVVKITFDEQ